MTTESLGFVPDQSPLRDAVHLVETYAKPQLLALPRPADGESAVLVVPQGMKAQSIKEHLDQYLPNPERRKGIAEFFDIASFNAHAIRFKNEHSVVFADNNMDKPSLTSVLNYHDAGASGTPRWNDHRGLYRFPLSKEWQAWTKINGAEMDQRTFAELLELRGPDVVPAPDFLQAPDDQLSDADRRLLKLIGLINARVAAPVQLMELSRGLKVHATHAVEEAITLSSGEVQVQFREEHKDEKGAPIKVPNLFLIAIPIFVNGPLYRIAVRLRYRLPQKILWTVDLYRPELSFEDAFNEACTTVRQQTELPVLIGKPEV